MRFKGATVDRRTRACLSFAPLMASYSRYALITIEQIGAVDVLFKNSASASAIFWSCRESSQQQALAELAKCSTVKIIASVDHFNAPCLWTQVHGHFSLFLQSVNEFLYLRRIRGVILYGWRLSFSFLL